MFKKSTLSFLLIFLINTSFIFAREVVVDINGMVCEFCVVTIEKSFQKKSEIKKVKERKSAVEQRMALIEQLQASRNIAPIVFDELAKLVPPGVAFETMTRSNNRIEIEGISDSNNRLSDFMRALDNSKVFISAELSTIKSDSSAARAISNFTLTFSINPNVAPVELEVSEAQK